MATWAEEFAKVPIEKIITDYSRLHMSQPDLARKQLGAYVSKLRASFVRRKETFDKRGLYSPAVDMVVSAKASKLPVKKLSYNQMIAEISRYQTFFSSVTSSVSGLLRVELEQDKRIFGETKGKPNRRMTPDERMRYWSLYDEYTHMPQSSKYGSNQIQRALADAMFTNEHGKTTVEILNRAEKILSGKKSTAYKGGANVYSGGWNNPTK